MAGLFDPNSFNDPRMGLFARLAGIAGQPSPSGALPGQPGSDAMASGAQPQAMPQMQQPSPQGGGGILDALTGFLGNHSNALMGLGAGIASGGLQHGVPMMAQGSQQDYQRQMQMMSLGMTAQALRARGVPESQIPALLLNPELMKAYAGNFAPATFSLGQVTDPNTGQASTVQASSRGGISAVNPGSLPRTPSPAAQAHIRTTTNPADIATFDQTYGAGAAERYRTMGF